MDIHKNAATTPRGRYEIVRRAALGERRADIARALGVSAKTVAKWLERHAAEGQAGLRDRRSRPHRLHRRAAPRGSHTPEPNADDSFPTNQALKTRIGERWLALAHPNWTGQVGVVSWDVSVPIEPAMPSPRAHPARLPVVLSPNPRRIVEAILFLIGDAERRGQRLTRYDIVKSMFIADKAHLNRYGRPITFDNYYAMKHGPVPSFVYSLLKEEESALRRAGLKRVPWTCQALDKGLFAYGKPKREADADVLSESDFEALSAALGTVLSLGFSQVRRLTHDDPAYKAAWHDETERKRFPMDYGLLFDEPDPARARELAFASAHL